MFMLKTFLDNHQDVDFDNNFVEALNIILECTSEEDIKASRSDNKNLLNFLIYKLDKNINALEDSIKRKSSEESINSLILMQDTILDFIKKYSWPEFLKEKQDYYIQSEKLKLSPPAALFHLYTIIKEKNYESIKHFNIVKNLFSSSVMDILKDVEASKLGNVDNVKLQELVDALSPSKSYNEYIDFLNSKETDLSQMDFFIINKLIELKQLNKLSDSVIIDFAFNFPESLEKVSDEVFSKLYEKIKNLNTKDLALDFSEFTFGYPRLCELSSLVKTKDIGQVFNILSYCARNEDFSIMRKYITMDINVLTLLISNLKNNTEYKIRSKSLIIVEQAMLLFTPTKEDLASILSQSIAYLPIVKKYYEKTKLEEAIKIGDSSSVKFKL